jgi:hypothetical protein
MSILDEVRGAHGMAARRGWRGAMEVVRNRSLFSTALCGHICSAFVIRQLGGRKRTIPGRSRFFSTGANDN